MATAQMPDEFFELIVHHLSPEQAVGPKGGRPRVRHKVAVRVIWFVLAGWWLALGHLILAIGLAITIIGLPFAWAHLKLAGASLFPVGKEIVPRGAVQVWSGGRTV